MKKNKIIKKIDIHNHITVYPEYIPPFPRNQSTRLLNVQEQIEVLDNLNVEKGVILPIVSPECQLTALTNQEAKHIVEQNPDRFIWFCNVDARQGMDIEYTIGFYKSLGAKGLGEQMTRIYADDPRMDHLFGCCARHEMPVLVHISPSLEETYGIVDEPGLPRIERMLKKHSDMKLIGHSSGFWCEISEYVPSSQIRRGYPEGKVKEGRLAKLMREYENLYCDLSAGSGANAMMRDPEYAARFLEEFSDRILYGTDVCYAQQTFQYKFDAFLVKMVDEGMLSQINYEKIVRGNAVRLLDL